jgi:DNA-binding transcriptional LysR family regulator
MQCFESAARHLSFTRAAEELSLTQSAVSKQVAQLEAILEHPLFRRVRRRLQLTAEGMLYLTDVRKVLNQVEMSTRYMQAYGGENEVLNLSTLPTFGSRWLMPRLNGFRFRHPSIVLNISNRAEAFDLDQANIDVAFFFGQGVWPRAECIPLLEERLIPVCAPALLAQAPVSQAADLLQRVLLQMAARPEQWHDWFETLGLYGEHSYYGPRFDSFEMVISAARAGCGLALVPDFLVQEELAEGKLVIPWDAPMAGKGGYYMAIPEYKFELQKVRDFCQWVLERC